jgi:hypothetical protein
MRIKGTKHGRSRTEDGEDTGKYTEMATSKWLVEEDYQPNSVHFKLLAQDWCKMLPRGSYLFSLTEQVALNGRGHWDGGPAGRRGGGLRMHEGRYRTKVIGKMYVKGDDR